MTNRVCTIGHSTRDLGEFLSLLRAGGVTCLVDVRSFPSSKRFPRWNQDAIVGALPPDIGYRWARKLGGRRYTPEGVPSANGGWRVKAFRDYADCMATDAFAERLDELTGPAGRERPAVMCSEAVPWRCRRRLITDALIVAGVEVVDIVSATTIRPAVLTAHAVVEDGRPTCPAPPPA